MTLCKLSALRFQYLEGDFIAGSWMWVIIFNRLIIVFRLHNCSKGLVLGDTFSCSGPGALATPPPPSPSTKENIKVFKPETIKGLSPSSKCYYFNCSRASRIQKFFLAVNTFQCSMTHPLWNSFRRPCCPKEALSEKIILLVR